MARYLKRTSKLFDISLIPSSVDISIRDLMCPVCRSILIEPVTLPCTHNLCLKCLKGTFEHNSLSCPLCRVRVGSWLRRATKTETLVNSELWHLIRTKFAKEVESKYNGDERNIDLDADFASTNKVLSTTGEIRQEYEAQLQKAKEEMQCQRKAEEIASKALIHKIQEEEKQQQLAQLTQDQLLAKSLVKKQLVDKHKTTSKYNNSLNVSNSSIRVSKFNVATMTEVNSYKVEPHSSKYRKTPPSESQDTAGLRSNITLISKIAYNLNNTNLSNVYNNSISKFCCQKSMPICNAISRSLKQKVTTKVIEPCVATCSVEPRMSASKIYGSQSKEELRVPNDVVNSKKKSLGVEVCMSSGDDDERTGSAESAGSHDSINQEIHHFKPIKAMPRTPLKISSDGKQIDPKLIRVVPVSKRISNIVPKPPSQTHLKRIIGCSWSAFRGRARQSYKEKEECNEEIEQIPSTSCSQLQIARKATKYQTVDNSIQKNYFLPEVSFDSNKNYTKDVNQTINGIRVNKKLMSEEQRDGRKVQKSWKAHVVKNGMVCKPKRLRTVWAVEGETAGNAKCTSGVETKNSTSSVSMNMSSLCDEESGVEEEDDITIENIAERIKKRKVNADKDKDFTSVSPLNPETMGRGNARKRLFRKAKFEYKTTADVPVTIQRRTRTKCNRTALSKSKQRSRVRPAEETIKRSSEKNDASIGYNCQDNNSSLRKITRKSRHANSSMNSGSDVMYNGAESNNYNSPESCSDVQECLSENNNTTGNTLSDEEIIKEQERMERLVIQEKEDFELARRLQAKFDEMQRIAGRTRRSRRAIESEMVELGSYKIDVGRSVQRAMNSHTAKSSILNHTKAKRRGRPPKHVK
ncbi:uncharacterized protein LOC108626104 [Ceratina calcarata]|uniref:RING-type E3 ubiquitin transferase n=1 Tax=Ceratina calcarata TaxID=156304 RepID=A0AAJ7N8E7_9HYME|nr:uncharacterized protein LOC108626104 [Ceratina calcarata]